MSTLPTYNNDRFQEKLKCLSPIQYREKAAAAKCSLLFTVYLVRVKCKFLLFI
ncbi:IS3 family transposase [Neobacillus driksii]|uniref:IS3 family transposase n=1 Tax=Neobacillus driksii TaxID=3035913 RepID=UPI0035B57F5A